MLKITPRYNTRACTTNCPCGSTKQPVISDFSYDSSFNERVVKSAYCPECSKSVIIGKAGLLLEQFNKLFPQGD
jgi:hypothetical protein